jgi:hypothetical protein
MANQSATTTLAREKIREENGEFKFFATSDAKADFFA